MKNKNIFYSMAEEGHMKIIRSILSLFILLSLMAVFFPFTPRAVQADDGTYHYDFIAHASEATWRSGAGNLSFPGSTSDSRGFVCYRNNIRGEDGATYARVLETHPQWVNDGYISGLYPEVITVMPGTALYLRVGFLDGAAGTDGVTFEVRYYYAEGVTPLEGWLAATTNEQYDGNMSLRSYPLDSLAGDRVRFRLVARAGPSSGRDWAIWAQAEIGPYEDLSIVSVEPVQVVYGAPLVAGKSTAFRVKVHSTFQVPIETNLGLELPEDDWDTHPPFTDVTADWEYPEFWGPVTIDPGDNTIMLPIVPAGREDVPWPDEPAGIIRRHWIRGVHGPDVRVVPRPIATPGVEEWQTVQFAVQVDPENNVDETDEGNNEYNGSEHVVITRGYKFAVFRINAFINEPGACPPIASAPSFGSADRVFEDSIEYLLGTFPIADSKISYSIMPTSVTADVEPRDAYLRMLYRMAASWGYNWAVGLTCGCCGATLFWDVKAVSIGNNTANIHNLAHEASHITSVVGAPDCYACGTDPVNCASCRSSEGFWVNAWQKYPRETPPSGWNVARDGNWSTNEWLRLCYYMDFSNYAPYCWTRLDPLRDDAGNLYTDGYRNLTSALYTLRDPEGLLVSGTVDQDNTIILDPFIRISDATLDIEPGNKGDYYIVLFDASNNILSKSGFSVSFLNDMRQKIDRTGFAYIVEWKDETKRIEIQNSNGSVLASRDVSLNKPEIMVVYPNGGEVFAVNETIEIRWNASDGDGDALTYSLAISMDSGETWLPIGIDITGNEYQLDTALLEVGQDYLVKVRATDGVNTAEDVSDGAFAISEEGEAQPGGGGCGMATAADTAPLALVSVVVAAWMTRRRRRRAA